MQNVGAVSNEKQDEVIASISHEKRRIAVRKKEEVMYEDNLEVKAQTMRVILKLWLKDEVDHVNSQWIRN
jgi:hypothetical protein